MNAKLSEVIFVGLPGPTHNYGGLAVGNVASARNAGEVAHPREAALQALTLMETLLELGLEVAVLPPQLRPDLVTLGAAGFSGTPAQMISAAAKAEPELLNRVYSSAAMWTANAATVTPSIDAQDGALHLTTANLVTNLHRSIEAKPTWRVLAQIFAGMSCHAPLPPQDEFGDEGAANHMRLAPSHSHPGLHVFVYGRDGATLTKRFPARQALMASRAIARRHHLRDSHTLFIQQNPAAIDAGVFHNDVIAVGNENFLLAHEHAFAGGSEDMARIAAAYAGLYGEPMLTRVVQSSELAVDEAVNSYFFNSQLVTLPGGGMAVLAPLEVREHAPAYALMEQLRQDSANPVKEVRYLDLRQSMKNGGGPACLRLRVPMTNEEVAQLRNNAHVLVDAALISALRQWVQAHYREQIAATDLANAALYEECSAALQALGSLLKLELLHAELG